ETLTTTPLGHARRAERRGEEESLMAKLATATRLRSGAMSSTMQEIGAALARQAETAGERLQSLATAVREARPTDGPAAVVSGGLESARSYLGERDVRDFGRDAVDLVRRYPVQAVLFGASLGWVVARVFSRRSPLAPEGRRLKDVMTRYVEVSRPDVPLEGAAAKMAGADPRLER